MLPFRRELFNQNLPCKIMDDTGMTFPTLKVAEIVSCSDELRYSLCCNIRFQSPVLLVCLLSCEYPRLSLFLCVGIGFRSLKTTSRIRRYVPAPTRRVSCRDIRSCTHSTTPR